MAPDAPDVQAIAIQYGAAYLATHPASPDQRKVLWALQSCRTAALGGHVDACDAYGVLRISYNSCRNRHCPQCQTLNQVRWGQARLSDLLDVGYFHVVFTLPAALNAVALQNPRIVYGLLFQAAAETVAELAADPHYLGAQIGMTAVLHTWGQNLQLHPHLHCVIPGGGLTPEGQWQPSRKKFFLPVKVLSRKFRGKFLALLQAAPLTFYGALADPAAFQTLLAPLYAQDWVVYCKAPFASAAHVVAYLGRDTHRVAIANSRIVRVADGLVTFRWRDYRDDNRLKLMTVTAEEFLRRFLLHVLPTGFTRIRHYGFLSARNKSTQLRRCQQLTHTLPSAEAALPESDVALFTQLTGRDATLCPVCHAGHLQWARASPPERLSA